MSSAWSAHRDSTPVVNSPHSFKNIQKLVQDAQIYSRERQVRLVTDVFNCCRSFNGLEPKLETFSSESKDSNPLYMARDNDKRLLTLKGVIPINYRSKTYQIPVTIYCPPRYPEAAPIPYVSPTENMVIRENHTNVNKSGRVYIPHYLSIWNERESTLYGLANTMVRVFSHCPPVNSRSSSSNHSNAKTHGKPSVRPSSVRPSTAASGYGTPPSRFTSSMPTSSTSSPSTYSNPMSYSVEQPATYGPTRVSPSTSQESQTASAASTSTSTSDAAEKMQLIKSLSVQLTTRFNEAGEKGFEELGSRMHQLDIMNDKVQTLSKEDQRQSDLKRTGERLKQRKQELTAWIDSMGASLEDKEVDVVVQYRDMAMSQIAECRAHDNALGDALDQVDEALVKGVVDHERYVMEVRELARKQFYPRALKKKLETERRLQSTNIENAGLRARATYTGNVEYEAMSSTA